MAADSVTLIASFRTQFFPENEESPDACL